MRKNRQTGNGEKPKSNNNKSRGHFNRRRKDKENSENNSLSSGNRQRADSLQKFKDFPDEIRQTLLSLDRYDDVLSNHPRHDRIAAASKELKKQMQRRSFDKSAVAKSESDKTHPTIGFLNSILKCANYMNIDGEFINFDQNKIIDEQDIDLMKEFCSDDLELLENKGDIRDSSKQPTCKTSFTSQHNHLLKKWQYLVHAMLDLIVFDLDKSEKQENVNLTFEKLILPWMEAQFQKTLENSENSENCSDPEISDEKANLILQNYKNINRFCVLSLLLHKLLNNREFVKNINLTSIEETSSDFSTPFQSFFDKIYDNLTVSKSHQMQMRFAKLIIKRPSGVSTQKYELLPNFFFKYYGDRPGDAKKILKNSEPMEIDQEIRLIGFIANHLKNIDPLDSKYEETCDTLYMMIKDMKNKKQLDFLKDDTMEIILHQIFQKLGFNFDYEDVATTTTDDESDKNSDSNIASEDQDFGDNFNLENAPEFNYDENNEKDYDSSDSDSLNSIEENFFNFGNGFLSQIQKIKQSNESNTIKILDKNIIKHCVDLLELVSELIDTGTVVNFINRIVGQEKTLPMNFPFYRIFRCLLERLSVCEDMSKSGHYSSLSDVLEFFKKRAVNSDGNQLNQDFVKLAKLLFCVPSVPIILDLINHLTADANTIKSCKFMVDVFSMVIHNEKKIALTFALPQLFDKYIINKIYKKCLTFNDPELEVGCLFLIQDFDINDSRINLETCSEIIANSLKKVDRLHILGHICIEWLMTHPKKLFTDDIVISLCQLLTLNELNFGMHGLVLTAFEALKYYTVVVTQGKNKVGLHYIARTCCTMLLQHSKPDYKKLGTELMANIPFDLLCHVDQVNNNQLYQLETSTGLSTIAESMNLPKVKAFEASFRLLMNNLIKNQLPEIKTIENIFWCFHREEKFDSNNNDSSSMENQKSDEKNYYSVDHTPLKIYEDAMSSNEAWMEWKILWEASRYIISNRLRSTLGAAKETLQAIESNLKMYDSELVKNQKVKLEGFIKTANSDDEFSDEDANYENGDGIHQNNYDDYKKHDFYDSKNPAVDSIQISELKFIVNHPHMLLQFLENLEKLIFAEYQSFVMTPSQTAVNETPDETVMMIKAFFAQNWKVCQGYFSNLRIPCIRVALHCGKPSSAIYHTQKKFEEFENNSNKLEVFKQRDWQLTVLMSIEGFLQLESPSEIESLLNFCKASDPNSPDIKYQWISACVLQCKGQYENAIYRFKSFIEQFKQCPSQLLANFDTQQMIGFLTQQLANCYAQLGDYKPLKHLIREHSFLREIINLDYHEAIELYNNRDYNRAAFFARKAVSTMLEGTEINNFNNFDSNTSGNISELKTWRWPKIKTAVAANNLLIQSSLSNNDPRIESNLKIAGLYSELMLKHITSQHVSYLPASTAQDFYLTNRYQIQLADFDVDDYGMLPMQLSKNQAFKHLDQSNYCNNWANLERAVSYDINKNFGPQKNNQHQVDDKRNLKLYEINSRHIRAAIDSENYDYARKVLLSSLGTVIFKSFQGVTGVVDNHCPVNLLASQFDNRYIHDLCEMAEKNMMQVGMQHAIRLQIHCADLMKRINFVEQAICCSISAAIRSFAPPPMAELSTESKNN